MEYIIISLLYLLVCYSNINNISSIVVALFSALLLFLTYKILRKENSNTSSILVLISFSLPISFRNIMGGEFSSNPLAWFYILGILYVFFVLASCFNKKDKITINSIGILVLLQIGLSITPFLISTYKIEAMKEYLTYLYFLILVFVSLINKRILAENEYNNVISAYVFGGLFASFGIIFQFIMFTYFSKTFFRIEFFGTSRKYFSFMFYDMSSATVYLATVAFLLLFFVKKRVGLNYILATFVIVAMAVSSARAGLAALFITVFFYAIKKKGLFSKIAIISLLIIFSIGSIFILNNVRGFQDSIAYVTYDSGRFQGYKDGLDFFLSSPIFGIGYDLGYKMSLSGLVVPHFAFINMLAQTGILITIIFLIIILWIYFESIKKGINHITWVIILSLIGSCIIPGFFSSRFFTVISMIVILKYSMVQPDLKIINNNKIK